MTLRQVLKEIGRDIKTTWGTMTIAEQIVFAGIVIAIGLILLAIGSAL